MSSTEQFFEPLHNGLVTARDPAVLGQGELTAAANAVYLPNDQCITKVKGRTKYVTNALGAAIKGMRYVEFDDFTNQLIVYSGDMYYRDGMSTSETGSADFTALLSNIVDALTGGTVAAGPILTTTTTNGFANVRVGYGVSSSGGQIPASTVVDRVISSTSVQISAALTGTITSGVDTITFTPSVGSGSTLEAVQYNNRHYLFNGVSNFVLETLSADTLSLRPHGMTPVSEPATVAEITGHWSTSLGIGYWFFITTEVIYPDSKNEIESTNLVPNSSIPYTEITSTDLTSGKTIAVTRPTVVANPNATHWRVYGAVNREAPTPPPLSSFQLMAQQQIDSTIALAGDVTLHGGAGRNPTAVDTNNNWSFPTLALGASNGQSAQTEISGANLQVDTFGFSAISNTFSGFKVVLKMAFGNASATAKTIEVAVQLMYGATPTATVAQSKIINVGKYSISAQTLEFGSNSDTWGRQYTAWASADVTNANFGVKVTVNRVGSSAMTKVFLDSVEVSVYTTSTTSTIVSYGKYFPVVVTSVGGLVSTLGANNAPPVATTGDIFDSQLVTNDTSDLSIIRYSLPDKVEYFPSIYFINFETKHTDEVTNIARLNSVLVVGLRNSIYRVNYLPRQEDSEFDRGRCYEPIAEDIGIVGTHAACNLTLPGGGIVRPFVSYNGLHVTDGGGFDTWSDDIDFKALVSTPAVDGTDYLKNCILVNYPTNYQLWFFYTPVGGTVNSRALVFHYHPSHMKANNKPKITGPITVNASAATLGKVDNQPLLVTGGDTSFALGKVFIEDRGFVDNSVTATPNVTGFSVRTREMYLAGIGRAVTVNTSFVRHRSDTASTIRVTPRSRFGAEAQANVTNDDATAGKTFTTTNGGAAELPFSFNAESMDYLFAEESPEGAQQIRLLGLGIEYRTTGLAERRS